MKKVKIYVRVVLLGRSWFKPSPHLNYLERHIKRYDIENAGLK
jgi:hypothetical protein